MISDRVWRTQFGADPNVVKQTVQLNARSFQVVGVMPAGFRFPGMDADVWTTTGWSADQRTQVSFRRGHYLRAIARLKPGVSLDGANAQLQVVVNRLKRDYPATNRVMGAGMTPLQDFLVGNTRQPLLVLMGSVALLLLIACANVGNLLLIQTAGRGREAALRLALGAGRVRLLRQALTESLVLSVFGGAAGLALGWWGTRALGAMQPAGMLPVAEIGVSWSVVGYVIAITTASGVLFGIAPVLWNNQRAPGEVLKDGGRATGIGPRMRRWGNALVVGEIAIALLLTIGASLLVRSFAQLQQVDPGFDPHGVLAISLNVPGARYDDAGKISGFYAELMERVRAIPGVESDAVTSNLPLSGGVGYTSDFTAAGRPIDGYGSEAGHRSVSPDYFGTMHVKITQGRGFTTADALNGDQVVVINDALARSYFRGRNPLGQRIAFDKVPDSTSTWRTIVGVVNDERQTDLATESQIEFITPERQAPSTFMSLVVRAAHDPVTLVAAVRQVVKEMDPAIGFTSVQTMDEMRAAALARQRFLMTLLTGFSLAGLLLAAVGVYGVMAHLARNRTREMGIRIALGARAASVQWLVVREGLRLLAVGLGAGLLIASAATRAMTAMLYHVSPGDPASFVVVPAALAVTTLAATWIPARRASRADPMETLRTE
jgi:putative ABC transport system permease protein